MLQTPTNIKIFEHQSNIQTTMEAMWDFHADPKAFSRLTPPPVFAQIHRRELRSLTDGEMEFTLWMGPIPVRWLAQHESGSIETAFVDRMIKGPLAYWRHEHIFEPTENGVRLTDRITIGHKPGLAGLFTRMAFDGLPLRLLFVYRHLRTRMSVSQA